MEHRTAETAIDRVLESVLTRLTPVLKSLALLVKHRALYIGFVIALPFLLFLLLVPSIAFHLFRLPWSMRVTAWLLQLMTLAAVVNTLIYGTASLLFFLQWWRKKLRVDEHKRLPMALSFALAPVMYGLMVAWGIASLRRHNADAFAYAVLSVFGLMGFGRTGLRLFAQKKQGAI